VNTSYLAKKKQNKEKHDRLNSLRLPSVDFVQTAPCRIRNFLITDFVGLLGMGGELIAFVLYGGELIQYFYR